MNAPGPITGLLAAIVGATLAGCVPTADAPLVGTPLPVGTWLANAEIRPTPSAIPPTPEVLPSPFPFPLAETPGTRSGSLHVLAVGDVMLGRQVNITSRESDDYTWPFHETADLLQGADLALGNLESPIRAGCRPTDSGDRFCADPRAVEGLAWAGFDALSLANNHIYDMGQAGFEETAALLEAAGIGTAYGEEVWITQAAGLRVAVMGLDDVRESADSEAVIPVIQSLDPYIDALLIVIHWGEEYTHQQTRRQHELGRTLIDAGADVIIGAHPHWAQPVERYGNGLIFYSLGNFVFDQMWSQKTREGFIADIRIDVQDGSRSINYELIPVMIYRYGQPRVEEHALTEADEIMRGQ